MASLVWKSRQAPLLLSSLTHLLLQPEAKGKSVKEGLEFPGVSLNINGHKTSTVSSPLDSDLVTPSVVLAPSWSILSWVV